MRNIAIVSTHPIQYYAPIFRILAKVVQVKVFYTWGEKAQHHHDPDFQQRITWDIPLLEGYDYEWVVNKSLDPGSHYRRGIVNPDLNERILAFQPDVLLIYGWNYESHWKAMHYFKGKVPVWFRGDSTLLNEKLGIKSWLKKMYLAWVYKHVDKAFYVGTANKAYFKRYGLQEDQLVFAPHAIDNKRFAEDRSEEAKALRESLEIDQKDRLILFAGKFEQNKDPLLLLDAFIQLHNDENTQISSRLKSGLKSQISADKDSKHQTPNSKLQTQDSGLKTHLLFVGNGILEEQLKDKVEQLQTHNSKLATQIHFLPFQNQSQMPVVYQACDVFCLPSQSETWGLAVNEAMAARKAVIVSNQVGCALDLVISGVNGHIFKSGILKDLVEKIKLVLDNHTKQQGQKSSEIIKNWSFEIQAKQYVDLLNISQKKGSFKL